MRRSWVLAGIVVIMLVVLLFAWVDGGREPLRPISEPVPLPGTAK